MHGPAPAAPFARRAAPAFVGGAVAQLAGVCAATLFAAAVCAAEAAHAAAVPTEAGAQAPVPVPTPNLPPAERADGPALPIVVLDPGHGGSQTGARGSCDVWEKDVTLPVAMYTADILRASGLVRAELTRTADVHVPLERRGQLANRLGAQLFVSVHANASPLPTARGIETFFLSLGASSRRVARLVQRENDGRPLRKLAAMEPLQRVLTGLQYDATHGESQALAMRMQRSLLAQVGGRGRGVLQAPFAVLMGAQMPATLVEVGFLTHAEECLRLTDGAGQRAVAEGLAAGILAYLAESQAVASPRSDAERREVR